MASGDQNRVLTPVADRNLTDVTSTGNAVHTATTSGSGGSTGTAKRPPGGFRFVNGSGAGAAT